MTTGRRVALVHDWLTVRGGAERVLESLLGLYPDAPVHTLVYSPDVFQGTRIGSADVRTSFLQSVPGSAVHYRWLLPLMPQAIEALRVQGFEVLLSVSDAVAHGVIPERDQLHINYISTPMRYVWAQYDEYLRNPSMRPGVPAIPFRLLAHWLRAWDLAASRRVHQFVANSNYVAGRVWQSYRRHAAVVYPPVEVDRFHAAARREDYYLTVSRLVPYKKIDLIIDAFRQMRRPLWVVGEGPEGARLRAMVPAGAPIQFLGRVDDEELAELYARARAFVYMAEEEFGIVCVEAQAAGCPVIAYGRGGATETVQDGLTGILFRHQNSSGLIRAVQEFEATADLFKPHVGRANAWRFRRERFEAAIGDLIDRAWASFERDRVVRVPLHA